jgi:hypothetical protein
MGGKEKCKLMAQQSECMAVIEWTRQEDELNVEWAAIFMASIICAEC